MKKTNAGRPIIKEYFFTATKKLNIYIAYTTNDELLQLGAIEDHNNKEGRPTNTQYSCYTGANIQIRPYISRVRSNVEMLQNKENESLKHKTTGSGNTFIINFEKWQEIFPWLEYDMIFNTYIINSTMLLFFLSSYISS